MSRVTIVIPFRSWDQWLAECVEACAAMDFQDFCIVLLPDEALEADQEPFLKRILAPGQWAVEVTGPLNPGAKRNIGMKTVPAEFFALIDADARPDIVWLSSSLNVLDAEMDVVLVAGPNLTPPNDPSGRLACGHAMESPLGFGPAYKRHVVLPRHEEEEMPSCNMVFRSAPGVFFREELDTGEDMMFCKDLCKTGERIIYLPECRVFHHRRTLYRPFMKQFYLYGVDKAHPLILKNRANHCWQALPTALTAYMLLLVISFCIPVLRHPWFALPMAVYLLAVVWESIRLSRRPFEAVLSVTAFIAGHISYGVGYVAGIFCRGGAGKSA